MLITTEQLAKICVNITPSLCKEIVDLLNELCPKYGMTDKGVFHEFLAIVLQESGEFKHKEENMNYRAQTLANTWPKRFSSTSRKPYAPNGLASRLAGKPVELANYVYGGRMGNHLPNDGWDFRGRGFIGVTGRGMFESYATYINEKTDECAKLMGTSNRYALDSALWVFCVKNDLEDEAKRDDFMGIIKSINGGYIGLKDRLFYLERVKRTIPL
jgi:putative chitinase